MMITSYPLFILFCVPERDMPVLFCVSACRHMKERMRAGGMYKESFNLPLLIAEKISHSKKAPG
jgi:hypothetical protein